VGGVALGLHKRKSHLSGFLREKYPHYANGNAFRRARPCACAARGLASFGLCTLSVSCVCVCEVKTGRHSTAALM
jgi:hypothetical protein